MTEPVKISGTLLDAAYVDKDKEVALLVECEKGKMQPRIPRTAIATFGDREEDDITLEMNKYVDILKAKCLGKKVSIVFDTDLDGKIKDGYELHY